MKEKSAKEDVKEAMFDIGLASASLNLVEEDDCGEPVPQVFPAYEILSDRVEKTLYYGRLPPTDRPSLALTQVAVEQFAEVGLQRLARLDMSRAADISRDACAGPTSLVLALIYLDRLKKANPEYLSNVSPADLFLVSMMVASKFIHDDGEEDEVFNDEWAKSGNIEVKELNRMEVDFLSAIDWRVNVPETEFSLTLEKIEQQIAFREASARGWASYTDLYVLSQLPHVERLWRLLTETSVKVTTVCMAAYAASILTLLGTATLLNQTPIGPAAVSKSFQTLLAAGDHEASEPVPESEKNATAMDHAAVSPAELLTASLIVTTLASRSETDSDLLDFNLENAKSAFISSDASVEGTRNTADYGFVVTKNDTPADEVPDWLLERTELIHHSTGPADADVFPDILPTNYLRSKLNYDTGPLYNLGSAGRDRLFSESDLEGELVRTFSKQWSQSIIQDFFGHQASKLQCPLRRGWGPLFNNILVLG